MAECVLCEGAEAMIEWYDQQFYDECDSDAARKEFVDAGYNGPGWYFWDETQTQCYGPYKTALKAHEESWRYAKEVLGHEPATGQETVEIGGAIHIREDDSVGTKKG